MKRKSRGTSARRNFSKETDPVIRLANTIQELAKQFTRPATPKDLEKILLLIQRSMGLRTRVFHTLDHLFDISSQLSTLECMAVLFHDIVYHQIDHGFPDHIKPIVFSVVEEQGSAIRIRNAGHSSGVRLALDIFGFKPGDELSPYAGLNEFLSAIVAVDTLSPFLNSADLAIIVACIEGTIPFRATTANQPGPTGKLYQRLSQLAPGFGWDDKTVIAITQASVRVGNADVGNFAEKEVAAFLGNTWMLLAESNPTLTSVGSYSVTSYRTALQKMEGFLGSLDPATVFHEFHGEPSKATFRILNQRARQNLSSAAEYIRAKLLTVLILEGLAELTGGDIPMSYFVGPARTSLRGSPFQKTLPKTLASGKRRPSTNATVSKLLLSGRANEIWFDTSASPLAGYVYSALGGSDTAKLCALGKTVLKGEITWKTFLQAVPKPLVQGFAKGASRFAILRGSELENVVNW